MEPSGTSSSEETKMAPEAARSSRACSLAASQPYTWTGPSVNMTVSRACSSARTAPSHHGLMPASRRRVPTVADHSSTAARAAAAASPSTALAAAAIPVAAPSPWSADMTNTTAPSSDCDASA